MPPYLVTGVVAGLIVQAEPSGTAEPSPTDAVGRGPTEFGYPIQHVAREERLGLSPGFRAGSLTRSDDRLVPKDHVLHACLPRVSGGFLPPPTAPSICTRRSVRSRARDRGLRRDSDVYRILKAYDLIPSPAFIVLAAKSFRHPTRRPNELWQTDFTYLQVVGWGAYYLSTVLDDYARCIIAWMLRTSMQAADVKETLDLVRAKTGIDRVRVVIGRGS